MRSVQTFLATPRGRLVLAGFTALLFVAGVLGAVTHDGPTTQLQADRAPKADDPVDATGDLPDDLLGVTTTTAAVPGAAVAAPSSTVAPSSSPGGPATTTTSTTVAAAGTCAGAAPTVDAKGLWLADVADGRLRHVVEAETNVYVWSPDGRYLAFLGGQDGHALHVYDNSTQTFRAVYTAHGVWGGPAWTADSRSLVFGGRTSSGSDDLYRVSVDGSNAQLVHDVNALVGDVEVRPDGSIVFTDGGTLAVVDAAGGNRRNLLVGNPNRSVATFTVSPDGTRVAFADRHDLVVMTIADAKQVKVGETESPGSAAEWSADGSRVLFNRVRPEGAISGVAARADGSDVREFGIRGVGATLSPDGKEAAWGSGVGTESPKVTATDLSNGADRVFAAGMWQPTWRPAQGGMSVLATVANQARPAVCLLPAAGAAGGGRRLAQFSPRAAPYSAMKWSPSGATVAFGSLT